MITSEIFKVRQGRKTGRCSSWDVSGRNADSWTVEPGETRVLADIRGPGQITHLWLAQSAHYRECVLRITWDNAPYPSVLCPLGDFFGLGHSLVASYQSALFSASTAHPNQFNRGQALNAYVPMPFRERALVELVNESHEEHVQYFYIDYETCEGAWPADTGLFHAEFRRANPFGGWGPGLSAISGETNIPNLGHDAWKNNYVILETQGCGNYIGCNLSITNLAGQWWGEGDDMIWVDGYKWPPDLHGTGTEDYFSQAWGMQDNAFLRCGSSVFEGHHVPVPSLEPWLQGGYQTSYVLHLENPIRFTREIKVTVEHGHANHLANEVSSVAYWYALEPARATALPSVGQRLPILRRNDGLWLADAARQCPGPLIDQGNKVSGSDD